MAQREMRADWTDREGIRERAKASARSFLSPVKADPEEERPLSPELVARVTEPDGEPAERNAGPEENNEDRLVRSTERSRINEAPSTIYPG